MEIRCHCNKIHEKNKPDKTERKQVSFGQKQLFSKQRISVKNGYFFRMYDTNANELQYSFDNGVKMTLTSSEMAIICN